MVEVPFLELNAQHAPIQAELERTAARVIASGCFVLGEEVAAFESQAARALGLARAVGVSSGSDALLALLMAHEIGPGDQVVTTPYSFFATAEAIVRVGAKPVFVDVEPDSFNLDPDLAAERVQRGVKAVLVVHLFGRVARTPPLEGACAAASIPLLEDAAQAIGARDREQRPVGAIGQAAALSFFPSKNLGGFGDGGMVVTNDEGLASRVRALRSHGALHKHEHRSIGGNFRLDELQAALLRVKLPHLQAWTASRARLAALYRRELSGLPIAAPPDNPGCVWNQFVVRVPDGRRDALAAHLSQERIGTAVYYRTPLHLQPALGFLGHRPGDFPRAERAAREALALPLYPGLEEAAVVRVAETVSAFFR